MEILDKNYSDQLFNTCSDFFRGPDVHIHYLISNQKPAKIRGNATLERAEVNKENGVHIFVDFCAVARERCIDGQTSTSFRRILRKIITKDIRVIFGLRDFFGSGHRTFIVHLLAKIS